MSLLDEEEQRYYCHKDDQLWLGRKKKWVGEIEPESKQTQTVKYCKKCGNKLEVEDEFCDKCGAEQKGIVATASATATATEEPEGRTLVPSAMMVIGLLLLIVGIVLFATNYQAMGGVEGVFLHAPDTQIPYEAMSLAGIFLGVFGFILLLVGAGMYLS